MKKNNDFRKVYLFLVIFLLSVVIYFWFYNSPYFDVFFQWSQNNTILFVFLLFLIKIIGIVYPPISGGIFTLGSIPFLGWQLAYLIDLSGSIIGGVIAYYLGKKYGFTYLNKIFTTKVTNKIKSLKVKKGKEIEAIIFYRILLGGIIIEAICYGAGLIGIDFTKFLIGSILSHVVVGIPTFYLASNILNSSNIILTIILCLIGIGIVFFTRGRYFD